LVNQTFIYPTFISGVLTFPLSRP